jgi:hypothetical protein
MFRGRRQARSSSFIPRDARVVRIFNHRLEQVTMHVRQEPGRFSTRADHIAREKVSGVERGTAWLLGKVKPIGPQSLAWAEAMLKHRGIEGVRVLQGLLRLAGDHPADAVEKACEIALAAGVFQLRPVRKLLARHGAKQQPLEFLEEHPIIRPLADYRDWLGAALSRDRGSPNGFGRHDGANECRGIPEAGGSDEKSPDDTHHRGLRVIHPPRSGYPSSGCSAAEPDSVSPDESTVAHVACLFQPTLLQEAQP